MQQSQAEIFRVAKDWEELYAPANLIRDARTASILLEWVIANEGIVSITGFNHAVAALGSQVLTPTPTPAELQAEAGKKEEARMGRDYLDSLKPQRVLDVQNLNAEKADTAKKEAYGKELKDIESQISREINEYQVGHHSCGMDYTKTEAGRDKLRKVLSEHGSRTTVEAAKRALSAVRDTKRRL